MNTLFPFMKYCSTYTKFCITSVLILIVVSTTFACKKKHTVTGGNAADTIAAEVFCNPLVYDSDFINTFIATDTLFKYHASEIKKFYKSRNFSFAWFNKDGLLEQGNYFINLLKHFDDQGLNDSVVYNFKLQALYNTFSDYTYQYSCADSITRQLDVLLTAEFFVYAQKVWSGLSEQKSRELNWYITRKTVPSTSILDSILSGGKNAFTAHEPVYGQYKLLRNVLKTYKTLNTHVQWDSMYLPAGEKFLTQGDSAFVLKSIKQKLFWLGDLSHYDSTQYFDSTLTNAVINFQNRYGLKPDGSIGSRFMSELNVPLSERIKQIEINMERCRWVPIEPQGDYIYVNIPEFKMHIYEGDKLAWSMNVVVGKTTTSTVIFNDELEYVVFSPYWTPPGSIISKEILPGVKKNINYLANHNMEVLSNGKVVDPNAIDWSKYKSSVPFTIRQKPGGDNSLGWVKFLFPNEHDIYFHDTPSRSLFGEVERTFSHGCIRLAEPQRLAEYLLRNDPTWTKSEIDSAMYSGKEKYVKLQQKIPVFIAYFTTWVDEDGKINFRKDVYKHDEKLENTLFGNTP